MEKCPICGFPLGGLSTKPVEHEGTIICETCFKKMKEVKINEVTPSVILSTTPSLNNYVIKEYIDLVCIEIAIGTGIVSEIAGGFSDFFGKRSKAFESKLKRLKEDAFKIVKYEAADKSGNAVVGIKMDYTVLSGNMLCLVLSGTIVLVEKNT